jgi:hypothetical protein
MRVKRDLPEKKDAIPTSYQQQLLSMKLNCKLGLQLLLEDPTSNTQQSHGLTDLKFMTAS